MATMIAGRSSMDGTETYRRQGRAVTRRAMLTLVIHRASGDTVEVAPVKCRLDTAEELSIYSAGGVLQRFAQDFLEPTPQRPEAGGYSLAVKLSAASTRSAITAAAVTSMPAPGRRW
jgi:hypothetical protein